MSLIQSSRETSAILSWNNGAFIQPFLDLSMAIAKRKTTRAVVETGGEVDQRETVLFTLLCHYIFQMCKSNTKLDR